MIFIKNGSMKYDLFISFIKNKNLSLYDAQQQKYDSIVENLNINNSSDICEIGCGWGGFIKRVKQINKDINIDGYTISKNQYGYTKLNHKNVFLKTIEISTKIQ